MSDLWFNIRFGARHLQVGPRIFRLMYNPAHSRGERGEGWRWFHVYQWFGRVA